MSTRTLGLPADLRHALTAALPPMHGHIIVTPRDADGRTCAAWSSEWYEVAAYYASMGTPLDELEAALRAWPGCIRTTQITGNPSRIRDEDWPGFARRKSRYALRPQVLALIGDPPQENKEQETAQ
jgi:hypothetical protein